MNEKRTPVETNAGIISGRDAIFLDELHFSYRTKTVEFTGELNSALCSNVDQDSKFVPYQLQFRDVLAFRMIDLDFESDESTCQSSFDVLENSSYVQALLDADHSGKVKVDHRHFVLATYDDVFEIIATGFTFDLSETSS